MWVCSVLVPMSASCPVLALLLLLLKLPRLRWRQKGWVRQLRWSQAQTARLLMMQEPSWRPQAHPPMPHHPVWRQQQVRCWQVALVVRLHQQVQQQGQPPAP